MADASLIQALKARLDQTIAEKDILQVRGDLAMQSRGHAKGH